MEKTVMSKILKPYRSLSLSPTVGALSEVVQITVRSFRFERDFDRWHAELVEVLSRLDSDRLRA